MARRAQLPPIFSRFQIKARFIRPCKRLAFRVASFALAFFCLSISHPNSLVLSNITKRFPFFISTSHLMPSPFKKSAVGRELNPACLYCVSPSTPLPRLNCCRSRSLSSTHQGITILPSMTAKSFLKAQPYAKPYIFIAVNPGTQPCIVVHLIV